MVKYENSKIYKIVCNITGDVYYGSTTCALSRRKASHKNDSNGCRSRIIIERGDYDIILVESFSCDNIEQLQQRERFYIESNECVNRNVPTRTRKEYKEANREYYSDYMKKYNEEHRDKKLVNDRLYYETNKETILKAMRTKDECECGCKVSHSNMVRHIKTEKHINIMKDKEIII